MAVQQELDMGIEKSFLRYVPVFWEENLCLQGFSRCVLSNHTWLSLIEFAVEMRERIEVRAMVTGLCFSLIAWNSWGLS